MAATFDLVKASSACAVRISFARCDQQTGLFLVPGQQCSPWRRNSEGIQVFVGMEEVIYVDRERERERES